MKCFPLLHLRLAVKAGVLALWGLTACTSVPEEGTVTIPPAAHEDEEYAKVTKKWSKSLRVFDRFQNRLEMHSVLFTEEMRQAYVSRWVKMRGDSRTRIGMDVGGKLAVFVSLFTPEDDFLRLDDEALWTIRLSYGEKVLNPVIVRRLFDKELYQSFFPFIHEWSNEYLVVFDVSVAESSDAMVLPSQVSAQFLSSLASVELAWK